LPRVFRCGFRRVPHSLSWRFTTTLWTVSKMTVVGATTMSALLCRGLSTGGLAAWCPHLWSLMTGGASVGTS
jgi:hypothetical protein